MQSSVVHRGFHCLPWVGLGPHPAPFRGNLEKAFKCRLSLSTHACALLSATSGLWGGGTQEDPPPRTAPSLCPCSSSIPWSMGRRGRPVLAPAASHRQPEARCAPGPWAQTRCCPLTGAQGAALSPQTDPREPRLGGPSRCWLCPCSPPGSPPLEDTPTLPFPAAQAPRPTPSPTGLACALDVQSWAWRPGR